MRTKTLRRLCRACVSVVAASAALAAAPHPPRPDAVFDALQKGMTALESGNFPLSVSLLRGVAGAAPDHPGVLFQLARAEAAAGHRERAYAALEKSARVGFASKASSEPHLRSFSNEPRFARVLTRVAANLRPVPAGGEVVSLAEKDLIPEGTSWDPASKRLFVSSLYKRKIVEVGSDGAARDFVPAAAGGIWQVLGMKVDAPRNRLLACSAADPQMIGFEEKDRGRSGLFSFDLRDGRLLSRYTVEPDPGRHLFNDLAVTRKGDVYVTDSEEGGVYRLDAAADRLERFLPAGTFAYPNGIALSPDERYLYVASFSGVDRVDLSSLARVRVALPHPPDVTLAGIDGLICAGGALIAVQNGVLPQRIARFELSPRFDRVVGHSILERLDPRVTDPTTGVPAGGDFLFIANAQIRSFDEKGKIFPEEKLESVRILKVPLRPAGTGADAS